jgi:hypothetical protein
MWHEKHRHTSAHAGSLEHLTRGDFDTREQEFRAGDLVDMPLTRPIAPNHHGCATNDPSPRPFVYDRANLSPEIVIAGAISGDSTGVRCKMAGDVRPFIPPF